MNFNKRVGLIVVALCLVVVPALVVKTAGQQEPSQAADVAQWEYLAVAGPSTTNLTATNNPRMRKEPNVPFGREAFVLEQHLDKLGANGWELVAVAGSPNDPAYYFKRPKRSENSK
ncbi:MAG TPA: hypothetical protein VFR78_15865 [Pyrinomonadaceae bacterium]|nr:hypothetical protein [Pyrinomonadaceae bacterium]